MQLHSTYIPPECTTNYYIAYYLSIFDKCTTEETFTRSRNSVIQDDDMINKHHQLHIDLPGVNKLGISYTNIWHTGAPPPYLKFNLKKTKTWICFHIKTPLYVKLDSFHVVILCSGWHTVLVVILYPYINVMHCSLLKMNRWSEWQW